MSLPIQQSGSAEAPALHLLRTRPDPRHLAAWAAHHGLLPRSQGDLGYALHGLLAAVFGEDAPQPFAYDAEQQALLAYTSLSPEALALHVALAEGPAAQALGLCATAGDAGYQLRAFPGNWPEGQVLRFEVRVRPIVREGKTGRERDAFLAAADLTPEAELDRQSVYAQWLKDQLGPRESGPREPWQGAMELLEVELLRFQLLEVLRQTTRTSADEGRKRRAVGGPDAVLQGRLRVIDSRAFAHLLARGVGRHRAFGFGMLLLRPAR
ncbi:type I-E CRISPR-associated protein Cas6/Cse3/CasE [Paucibacter sp. XJ19-41]|uniref:type I-E CRISPR-associated protein Cas6/Cse3/CasE n=1 Tax=Paucibacter sp. XJ19-41 TaxID=2927824 RepID=UPI00234BD0AB|nr:type I-E CRISPR-associated protein Cas6/Cse3/CasE [Paucibacter sp. XJ19-41]MDC6166469.1 type I-E CRISPR-associated protein Cas6/Cse3/CasE [Paucibacter sp. XJ19-41]